MKAKRPMTFDDLYLAARVRVAKKAAVERQGGCAPHLTTGASLPSFPSGLGSIHLSDVLDGEDPLASEWAASVLDLAQDEQASRAGGEEQAEAPTDQLATDEIAPVPEFNDLARSRQSTKDPARNTRANIEDDRSDRPRSTNVGAKLMRFKSKESLASTWAGSVHSMKVDPGLADLLVTLAARYEGRSEGLSELETSRLHSAFDRFKIPGESDLYVEDLQVVLNYLGHVLTSKEAIDSVLRGQVTMYDYIDFNEYLLFMEKFYEYERSEFRTKFDEFDTDGSHQIDLPAVRQLLKGIGFHPLLQMTKEAVDIVHRMEDGDSDFSFDEVCMLLAVYGFHEGFNREETEELRRQFDFFSIEGQGPQKNQRLLPPVNLSDALVQVFGVEVQEFTVLLGEQLASGQGLQKSSFDRGGNEPVSINFDEFLIMARKIRVQDYGLCKETYGHLFAQLSAQDDPGNVDPSQRVGIGEAAIRQILKKRNYTPLRNVLDEILELVHEDDWNPDKSTLDFDEFFNFMTVFNCRDGFTYDECEELRKTYDRFDEDSSGEVSAMEIAALFRHVGYRLNLEDIRDEVAEVDANGSGQLDFREFLRLMRLYREKELAKVKKAFHSCKDSSTNLLPGKVLPDVLKALEHEPPSPDIENDDMTFDELVDLVDSCRSTFVAKERKKAGFSDEELEHFADMFKRFDKDKSETIDNKELQGILKEFGWEPRTREEQQVLINKLDAARALAREAGAEDCNASGSSNVQFWSFIQLIRMLRTDQDKAEERALNEVQRELGFSEGETEEFRQVFRTWVRKSRELTGEKAPEGKGGNSAPETIPRDSIHRLVRSLGLQVSPKDKEVLDKKVTSLDSEGRVETAKIDFCAFLRLMRWILQTDFAGVNDATRAKPASSET